MKSARLLMPATTAFLACAAPLPAHAQGVPSRRAALEAQRPRAVAAADDDGDTLALATEPDAPNQPIAVPAGVRSLHVLRPGEVIRVRPDVAGGRRGTAARDAYLPVLAATTGPGCRARWYRVGRDAWMCGDEVELSPELPHAQTEPAVPPGETTPHHYAFAAYSGVATYRRLQDVDTDDWAEQLEHGMGVAIDGTGRATNGRVYVHVSSNRWIAMTDLHFARPSNREGLTYEPDEALQGIGFVRVRTATYATPDAAARRAHPQGFLEMRAPVHLREEQLVNGRNVVRTDAGWILANAVSAPDVPAPPAGVGPMERWVDVDVQRQMLVAFEGGRPVYTTLVSTGRADHPTRPGTFRVWIRVATADMSNADDAELDATTPVYSVERVPWVMYFNGDQALHGAYWHDQFGTRRSHGCVNLAPRDAQWLFSWAPPGLPPGWNAVLPTRDEPGMLVRVR